MRLLLDSHVVPWAVDDPPDPRQLVWRVNKFGQLEGGRETPLRPLPARPAGERVCSALRRAQPRKLIHLPASWQGSREGVGGSF